MSLQFFDYPGHIKQMIAAALAASDPGQAVQRHLRFNGRSLAIGRETIIHTHYPADGRIFLVSVGKAAVPMALAASDSLGEHLTAGVIVAKQGEREWQGELAGSIFAAQPQEFQLFEAGHPVSNEVSVAAATAVAQMLAQTTAHDLVLCLISGGASALLSQPRISLGDWQQLTNALLASGCTINELNSVRQQLDRVKGGGLAQWASPGYLHRSDTQRCGGQSAGHDRQRTDGAQQQHPNRSGHHSGAISGKQTIRNGRLAADYPDAAPAKRPAATYRNTYPKFDNWRRAAGGPGSHDKSSPVRLHTTPYNCPA